MDNNLIAYEQFDEDQRKEIRTGVIEGLDVTCYAKQEYLAIQMRQIRLGLQEGLDVSVYDKPEYDWFQMEEIRLGMLAKVDYEIYAKPEIDYQRMRQIRKGLEDGIDLSPFVKIEAGILEELRKSILAKVPLVDYIKEGYVVDQLVEIRTALEKKINIRPYITVEFRGASIREICLGLEAGLPVKQYASLDYGWQQMREIRLGMEARVDVSLYSNCLFSWQQMREIRLGLEDGLDVEFYRQFIYTASIMEQMRKDLLLKETQEIIDRGLHQQMMDEQIAIFLSKDEMEACIEVVGGGKEVTEKDVLDKLKRHGVTQGILREEVKRLVEEKRYDQTIVIAKGQMPQTGQDGWYEFFFDTKPSRSPRILEDGTADFKDVKWFEIVEENQKLAYYHSADFGVAGYTVTGKFLKARRGKEKNVLRGKGFRLEADGKTYTSLMNGRIYYDGAQHLDVSRLCIFENVNLAVGNINFDGTVLVKGNVGSGVSITASENVYVDGYVEAATIRSGGEIFLRKGVNGNGSGIIDAKHNVVGQFFEDVQVIAGGDIVGQYCMNCKLYAEGMISLQGIKGLLIGGVARAVKGISVYSIGNKANLRTVLSVGIDHETLRQQQKLNVEIENVNRELSILCHSQASYQKKYAAEVRNTMDIYLKIENAIYTKELQMKQLLDEKAGMDERLQEMQGAKVTATGVIYEGTEIHIDNVTWKAFAVKDVIVRCVNQKVLVESQ